MALLISPMIVPLIISAAAMFFFYSRINLQGTFTGVILAHAALSTPFVVITVTATLSGFDQSLIRAAQSLGASPTVTFFRVVVPLILPGVISGALFAFITSFDEVVVVLFVGSHEQRTIPWQMFSGIRERISPDDIVGGDDTGFDFHRAAVDPGMASPPQRAPSRTRAELTICGGLRARRLRFRV